MVSLRKHYKRLGIGCEYLVCSEALLCTKCCLMCEMKETCIEIMEGRITEELFVHHQKLLFECEINYALPFFQQYIQSAM